MNESVRLTVFSVTDCGYYKKNKKVPEFGSFSDTVIDLENWIQNKELGSTCTYEIEEHDHLHPAYCFNLYPGDKGDYLLTIWNAVPATNGHVLSVDSKAVVGSASVTHNKVKKDSIPGYPTYFWLIPQHNLLATVSLSNVVTGLSCANKYLQSFLAQCSSHVVIGEKEAKADHVISGYREKDGSSLQHLYPRFRSRMVQKPGELAILRKHYNKIHRIISRQELPQTAINNTTLAYKMLSTLGIVTPQSVKDQVRVKYEIDYRPSLKELDAMIDQWQHDGVNSKFDDIGFYVKGYKAPVWLSHTSLRETIDAEVNIDNEAIMNPLFLLNLLQTRRAHIVEKALA